MPERQMSRRVCLRRIDRGEDLRSSGRLDLGRLDLLRDTMRAQRATDFFIPLFALLVA